MSILSDILARLPSISRNRYADSWWIATANRILGDIERYTDQSGQIIEVPLLTIENVIEYSIPSTIRRVIRLRAVVNPAVTTARVGHGLVPYRIIGGKIRLSALPITSDDTDISGTVTAVSSTNHKITSVSITEASNSRLLRLTHTTGGAIEYRIISDSEVGYAQPNSLFDVIPAINDTFLITSNYFILEGFKFLTRFTLVSSTVPLDLMFEKVLEDGLRYYTEIQTDAESSSAAIWNRQYQISMKEYRDYYRRPIGDQGQVQIDDGWGNLG